MYVKKRRERPPKYFRYAPPMTKLDTKTEDRPNPPFYKAPPERCSVYYYWWAFLRENEGYLACCKRRGKGAFAELYADFGDVRDDEFFEWWRRRGLSLFCEPSADEPEVHRYPPDEVDGENEILVTIPIVGDLENTMIQVKVLLKMAMQERKERLKRLSIKDRGNSRYPVHTMPVLTSLHQTLTIWQAKKRLHEGATLAEIGREAGLASALAYGGRDKASLALTATTVSRCLKAAGCLIENVGQGRFPDTSGFIEKKQGTGKKLGRPKKVTRK